MQVVRHEDMGAWARAQGVSVEACELLAASPFVDLHCDLEVPVRVLGYDPTKRHGPWRRGPMPFMAQTDYPRLIEAGFSGVCHDIATNVLRRPEDLQRVTLENVARVQARVRAHPDQLALVRTNAEHDAAQAEGKLAVWVCLQGGNALAHDPTVLDGPLGEAIHRITLVHLSSSVFGGSNSPGQPDAGITAAGRAFVARCNDRKILVDLAHAGRATFWGAIEAHSDALPPLVSHTGLDAVRPHWRNIDDDQARAIADRGGVVGIIYQGNFLDRVPSGFPCKRAAILDHLEHVIDVAGEDTAAIGTDYDGMITPPWDLPDVTDHPKLVQDMLDRGWSSARIRKVLGENHLRVVEAALG